MRWIGIAAGILALAVGGGYLLTLPRFPALDGVTRVELRGPQGGLRDITQPDTVALLAAFAARHEPRWRSVLAPARGGGPLAVTFYRGREELRTIRFGAGAILSCYGDACAGAPLDAVATRAFGALLGVPTKIVDFPPRDPAA